MTSARNVAANRRPRSFAFGIISRCRLCSRRNGYRVLDLIPFATLITQSMDFVVTASPARRSILVRFCRPNDDTARGSGVYRQCATLIRGFHAFPHKLPATTATASSRARTQLPVLVPGSTKHLCEPSSSTMKHRECVGRERAS